MSKSWNKPAAIFVSLLSVNSPTCAHAIVECRTETCGRRLLGTFVSFSCFSEADFFWDCRYISFRYAVQQREPWSCFAKKGNYRRIFRPPSPLPSHLLKCWWLCLNCPGLFKFSLWTGSIKSKKNRREERAEHQLRRLCSNSELSLSFISK